MFISLRKREHHNSDTHNSYHCMYHTYIPYCPDNESDNPENDKCSWKHCGLEQHSGCTGNHHLGHRNLTSIRRTCNEYRTGSSCIQESSPHTCGNDTLKLHRDRSYSPEWNSCVHMKHHCNRRNQHTVELR